MGDVMVGSSVAMAAAAAASTLATPAAFAEQQQQEQQYVLASVRAALVNSWPVQLSTETPENLQKSRRSMGLDAAMDTNQTKRPVFNGHWIPVQPTGLPNPRLILYSKDVACNLLKMSVEQVESTEFTNWVSGNLVLEPVDVSIPTASWATPYALSIMGTRYTNNCPFGTGNGYGDGRAISIGELHGHELQLKGAGKTPFHRGADGRAVLRSSIREFLASEAMYYLGVNTTRALSLVVSEDSDDGKVKGETVTRPWYAEGSVLQLPDENHPQLQKYDVDKRREIIQQLRVTQKADPNILITEPTAITCRVAPSFVRIGHLDLYARRVEAVSMKQPVPNERYNTNTLEWKELEQMLWHACYREYKSTAYDPFIQQKDIAAAATAFLEGAAERIATMVAHWVRVGFTQGNFNADNCLVGGHTMDYGPFGWMEEYNPVFAKWTGSGQHFGFLNQPTAGFTNYAVLVQSVAPIIWAKSHKYLNADDQEAYEQMVESITEQAGQVFQEKVDETFRIKLGFAPDQDVGDDVWRMLEPLLRKSRVDWTLLFRRLTYIMRDFPYNDKAEDDYEAMLDALHQDTYVGAGAFYEPLTPELKRQWLAWIQEWRSTLQRIHPSDNDDNDHVALSIYQRMRTVNPKFVLREWMLVDAYTAAANREEAELFSLYHLIQNPYDEGTAMETKKYFRRAPDEALRTGGTAFMSCSS